jgi:hypothetical protein
MTRKAKKYPQFVFSVVQWDETGNQLLFKKTVKVRRACRFTAKDYVIGKYPRPYFIELDSINF